MRKFLSLKRNVFLIIFYFKNRLFNTLYIINFNVSYLINFWLQLHSYCYKNIPQECTFGNLEPIYLPPHAVSIPRTEVPMEAIIGVQVRRKEALAREYSCRKCLYCTKYTFQISIRGCVTRDRIIDGSSGMKLCSRIRVL